MTNPLSRLRAEVKAASINGPLRYTMHERKDDRGRATWAEVECTSKERSWHICQCPDEEDATLIVTATRLARAVADEKSVEVLARTLLESAGGSLDPDAWELFTDEAQDVLTALAAMAMGGEDE